MDYQVSSSQKIVSIHYLRAAGALAIVLFHIGQRLSRVGYQDATVEQVMRTGYIGVDVFFVVSGYIMARLTSGAVRDRLTPSAFLLRRLIRIFPMYWLVSAALLVVHVFSPQLLNASSGAPNPVLSFLLIPNGGPFLLGPGWTLSHEMFFYLLIFGSLAFSERTGLRITVGVICLFSLLGVTGLAKSPDGRPNPVLDMMCYDINLAFVMGMALFYGQHTWLTRVSAHVATLLAIVALGFAYRFGFDDVLPRVVRYGLPAAFIVAWMLVLESRRSLPSIRSGLALGDISYAIYLVHLPVLGLMVLLFQYTMPGGLLTGALFGAVCLVVTIVVAVLVHRLVERPLLLWGHSLVGQRAVGVR